LEEQTLREAFLVSNFVSGAERRKEKKKESTAKHW
jgi:hypothetical protein